MHHPKRANRYQIILWISGLSQTSKSYRYLHVAFHSFFHLIRFPLPLLFLLPPPSYCIQSFDNIRYLMEPLVSLCEKEAIKILSLDTVIPVYEYAQLYRSRKVTDECIIYVKVRLLPCWLPQYLIFFFLLLLSLKLLSWFILSSAELWEIASYQRLISGKLVYINSPVCRGTLPIISSASYSSSSSHNNNNTPSILYSFGR